MLVNGYHTACQLIACEWVGRFGHEPEAIPRWHGWAANQEPPGMPQDLPYAWAPEAGEVPAHPDVDHWVFDVPNGARNGNELYDAGPLIIPCPNEAIVVTCRQAVAAWERSRDVWLNAPLPDGEPARAEADYAIAAPVRPNAPAGMVRAPHRAMVWGDGIEGVNRALVDDLPALGIREHPERLTVAEWNILCRRANVY